VRTVQIGFCLVVGIVSGTGCDMAPAEILEAPRVLALRTEPAALAPGEPHTLTALTFAVEAELDWSWCDVAWSPTEPPSCATGQIALGQGNPLVATLPEADSGWLLAVPLDDSALPAVKRLEVGSGAANPVVSGITTNAGTTTTVVAPGSTVELRAQTEGDAAQLVVSWYVTDGTLEPARTLASEAATLEAPSAPGPLRVIAVVREQAGGTGWAEATLDVGSEVR